MDVYEMQLYVLNVKQYLQYIYLNIWYNLFDIELY
jgi:hypothetical protein